MAKIYLHSVVNGSATRAHVKIVTPKGSRMLANVFKREGFWHAHSELGVALLHPLPHTTISGKDVNELPLGAVLKLLREAVTGALSAPSVRNAA